MGLDGLMKIFATEPNFILMPVFFDGDRWSLTILSYSIQSKIYKNSLALLPSKVPPKYYGLSLKTVWIKYYPNVKFFCPNITMKKYGVL
jgi:hypothetical protein